MRPIAKEGVVWSVGQLVDPDAIWGAYTGGSKEPCFRWGPDTPCEGAILRGKGGPIVKY